MADVDSVPSFSTGATFLDANSQAHHKPLSAFGDLTDNARESTAQQLWIDAKKNNDKRGRLTITMTDNGCGMSEYIMRTGIGGIAHSNKGLNAETHYGMGAKSSLPRLSSSSLVFSKNGQTRTVALISTTLSRERGWAELKVPVATWPSRGSELLSETTVDAPLTHKERVSSLEVLLENTCFSTVRELLAQFDEIPGDTGTRLVLYDCDAQQFDITSTPDDIRVADGASDESADEHHQHVLVDHDSSLREYLMVLYYSDATTRPRMGIYLRGTLVPPRNWSTFLRGWPSGRPAYKYTPYCLASEEDVKGKPKAYGADVRFGMIAGLDEVYKALSTKGKLQPHVQALKTRLDSYKGVFYYNHDRLIMPLERLPKQAEANKGNQMMTAHKRITVYGTVLVGVCREGFLIPEHNKAGYKAKTCVHARGG